MRTAALQVPSFDGTRLNAARRGTAKGLPLLVIPGIGASTGPLRASLDPLAGAHPILSWDLRGLFDSEPPVSDRIDAAAHAEDAVAVADAFGVDRVALWSWSTGSRIAFEIALRYPELVAGAVVVCGGTGHPLSRLRFLELSSLMTFSAGFLKHFASTFEAPFRAFVSRPEFAGVLRQSGVVGATADVKALVELFRSMADCDLKRVMAIYEAVAGASTPRERLRAISCPVMLVAGDRDPFTPLRLVHETADTLSDVRVLVYGGATHYLPMEFPDRLADDVKEFLDEIAAKPGVD